MLATRSTVVERYRKRDRDFVVNEVDYCDADGRLARALAHASVVPRREEADDAPGFVVDRESAAKKERRAARARATARSSRPSSSRSTSRPAGASAGPAKNYHTDRDEAVKLGFPDVVVQGMLSTCLVSQLMANAFGKGWLAGGRMDVKLVNVLWGGERVRARGKVRGEEAEGSARRTLVDVWVEKDDAGRTPVIVGAASALPTSDSSRKRSSACAISCADGVALVGVLLARALQDAHERLGNLGPDRRGSGSTRVELLVDDARRR